MLRKTMLALLIATACMLVASQAYAFPMTGVAYYATSDWTGSVYWELYAPGDSASYLSADSDWHYFYYAVNDDDSDVELSLFSVGNPSQAPITDSGWLDRAGGTVAPGLVSDLGSSIKYYFFGPNWIEPGDETEWLYFKTPIAPQWVSGSLQNSINDYDPVPGPAPEPASVVMLGLGLIGMASRTIRKKFTA